MPETQDWAAPLQSPVTLLGNQPIQATEAGNIVTLNISVAARRLVVVSLVVTPDATAPGSGTLRDWVTIILAGATVTPQLGRCALSPESPLGVVPLIYGQAVAGIDEDLTITATSRNGSGSQLLVYDLLYYLQ